MNYSIIDFETDGLLDDEGEKKGATKIHCMSVKRFYSGDIAKFTLIDYDEIRSFFEQEECIVGHNLIRFDVPTAEKLLAIRIKCRQVDTLGLSWYLYPDRYEHGLGAWGDDLGIKKPEIADWQNLGVEEYIYRCEQDVEINSLLFDLQCEYLMNIYENVDEAKRIMYYLSWKLQCAREQEEVKWRVDVEKTQQNLLLLTSEKEIKAKVLTEFMPKQVKYRKAARPKVMYKKDGSVSAHGEKWFELLREMGLPDYHVGTVLVPIEEIAGNPFSTAQLKAWLFSLGWIPDHYKVVKDVDKETGTWTNRKVPQIGHEEGGGKLSQSVENLVEQTPELENLEGLFVIKHREGILQNFLKFKDSHNFVKSTIGGFTNTLRFQHKNPIVNLPQIPKLYWKEVRECLIAPEEGYILCGADMTGLEDNTKRHYIWPHDPEYVKEQMIPGFDAHLDIAILSGLLTPEDVDTYKQYNKDRERAELLKIPFIKTPEEKEKFGVVKGTRLKAKKTNFAAIYLAGPPKIAVTANIPIFEAKLFHTVYWKRNWAVKKIAEETYYKTIGGQMWLYNPVSRFYCALREEKDIFSTLNQGTGVYCFDTWVRNVRDKGIRICMQYHDEIVFPLKIEDKEIVTNKLRLAIKEANEELQLNVELPISIEFGINYAEIH